LPNMSAPDKVENNSHVILPHPARNREHPKTPKTLSAHSPRVVDRCLSSWQRHNPDWDIRILDITNWAKVIDMPDLHRNDIGYAALSDILRINLLSRFGGIWVDATLFCCKPLDEWLWPVFEAGFFAFSWGEGDHRPLASWFLAARQDHVLTTRWRERVHEYWAAHNHATDYFWFHHLFAALCESDGEFSAEWRRVPRLSAVPPHAIQAVGMTSAASLDDARISRDTPVFKLSRHVNAGNYRSDTLVWKLLEVD
jgi:hypothetical protein